MIITQLKIKSFGKLNNLNIEFGDKLNVVYGPNEAGKTTILAFIKAMLYGMTSRKRDIRENDRLRFQPWHGDFGAGELYFKDENKSEFVIRRNLGNVRRDNLQVTSVQTGQRIPEYERNNPGEAILGLGEAAFMRTIYVPQLGCTVSPDKDDEIMARLMNLQETGEEQVSLLKALDNLEKERKKITIRSGNGKLDKLYTLQFNLHREKEKVERLHDENIADQTELNHLLERKAHVQNELKELEEKENILKKHQQYLEYEELRNRQRELNSLEQDLKRIDDQLWCGERPVDVLFLQEVRTELMEWHNRDKQLKDLEKELKDKSVEMKEIEDALSGFSGFEGLGDNIGTQVFLHEKNRETLAEKISFLEKQRKEKEELEQQLANKKAHLGLLSAFYQITPAEEEEISRKEEYKLELEDELKKDNRVDHLRRDMTRDRLKNARILMVSSFVAALLGIIFGLVLHPVSFILSLLGTIVGFYGFIQVKKFKAALAEMEKQLTNTDQDRLRKELEKVSAELFAVYQRYGVSDSKEFAAKKKRFDLENNEIRILETQIRDRSDQFFQEEEIRKQLKECIDYLENILALTGCNSVVDFNAKLKIFSQYKNSQENIRRDIENLSSKIDQLLTSKKELEKTICDKLGLKPDGREAMVEAENFIKETEARLTRKNELIIRLETSKKNFQERLTGRNLAEIAAAAEEYRAQNIIEPDLEDENDLQSRLKELNEERLEIAKRIIGLESGISNRFKDVWDIAAIEEELDQVTQQIRHYEEILDVLDLVKMMLTESFGELQKSFGPILNNKVGSILNKITGGKYGEVGIAENYNITVKDDHQWTRELEYFSNGTLDQVYFALRLGIIGLAYENGIKLPLILDDTFVQYDDERLASVLEYLLDYAKEHQVLLFTCHRREAEMLQGKEFNYINL